VHCSKQHSGIELDGITAVYVDVVFGELLAKLDRAWLDSTLVGLKGNQRINGLLRGGGWDHLDGVG
jgi:hypothetical protein